MAWASFRRPILPQRATHVLNQLCYPCPEPVPLGATGAGIEWRREMRSEVGVRGLGLGVREETLTRSASEGHRPLFVTRGSWRVGSKTRAQSAGGLLVSPPAS